MSNTQHPPLPAVRLGTRGSALARWQTEHVAGLLAAAWPGLGIEIEVLHTQGDRILDKPLPAIGGKGLFTAELEDALRRGAIDLAVHSLKDLPTEEADGLRVGAIPPRAGVEDALISRSGLSLAELPPGATVGASSRRRGAQIRRRFPHLVMLDIRGNVDTRLRKALDPDGPYDAIVLARAGLERLGLGGAISQILPLEWMLPAPGQGALAVQCRADDALLALLAPLDHAATRAAVEAERAFLAGLGGGCSVPVAAHAHLDGDVITLIGRVTAPDGSQQVEVTGQTDAGQVGWIVALALGRRLAEQALAEGAAELLSELGFAG